MHPKYMYRSTKTHAYTHAHTHARAHTEDMYAVVCVLVHLLMVCMLVCVYNATDLSVPFQKGVPEGKLFTPEFSASRMLAVLERIDASRAGGFFDWKGDAIPW